MLTQNRRLCVAFAAGERASDKAEAETTVQTRQAMSALLTGISIIWYWGNREVGNRLEFRLMFIE
jgi:hypothetical protein